MFRSPREEARVARPRMLAAAAAAVAVLLVAGVAHADRPPLRGGDIGLGLVLGAPTGVSAQVGFGGPGEGTALNLALGLDLLDDQDLYFHVDYAFLVANLVSSHSIALPAYVGIGGFFRDKHNSSLGARVPFGLQLEFLAAPLHIFGEIALQMPIVDDFDLHVVGAIGFRYFI